ncbi:uncharacterized protein LOC143449529 [Clavelina lepadiformis]|uniref:uncharacterized protein LOC143449529 n=1 Tax=Clavelina lepadiformis TaxID=159417 RepID=UPI0040434923
MRKSRLKTSQKLEVKFDTKDEGGDAGGKEKRPTRKNQRRQIQRAKSTLRKVEEKRVLAKKSKKSATTTNEDYETSSWDETSLHEYNSLESPTIQLFSTSLLQDSEKNVNVDISRAATLCNDHSQSATIDDRVTVSREDCVTTPNRTNKVERQRVSDRDGKSPAFPKFSRRRKARCLQQSPPKTAPLHVVNIDLADSSQINTKETSSPFNAVPVKSAEACDFIQNLLDISFGKEATSDQETDTATDTPCTSLVDQKPDLLCDLFEP